MDDDVPDAIFAIRLPDPHGKKRFRKLQDFVDFLEAERTFWDIIQAKSPNSEDRLKSLRNRFITNIDNVLTVVRKQVPALPDPGATQTLRDAFSDYFSRERGNLYSQSSEGGFVKYVAEKFGAETAAYVTSNFLNNNDSADSMGRMLTLLFREGLMIQSAPKSSMV